jgi:hypothetical protein
MPDIYTGRIRQLAERHAPAATQRRSRDARRPRGGASAANGVPGMTHPDIHAADGQVKTMGFIWTWIYSMLICTEIIRMENEHVRSP